MSVLCLVTSWLIFDFPFLLSLSLSFLLPVSVYMQHCEACAGCLLTSFALVFLGSRFCFGFLPLHWESEGYYLRDDRYCVWRSGVFVRERSDLHLSRWL